jgi:hypothetical protein
MMVGWLVGAHWSCQELKFVLESAGWTIRWDISRRFWNVRLCWTYLHISVVAIRFPLPIFWGRGYQCVQPTMKWQIGGIDLDPCQPWRIVGAFITAQHLYLYNIEFRAGNMASEFDPNYRYRYPHIFKIRSTENLEKKVSIYPSISTSYIMLSGELNCIKAGFWTNRVDIWVRYLDSQINQATNSPGTSPRLWFLVIDCWMSYGIFRALVG